MKEAKLKTNQKSTEKYVTMTVFERSMAAIAVSFQKVDERFDKHDQFFETIFLELHAIRETGEETLRTLSRISF